MDNHDHGLSGAFVALCDLRYINELLDWLKSINHFQFTLGTVTQVAIPYDYCLSLFVFHNVKQYTKNEEMQVQTLLLLLLFMGS